MAAVHFYIDLFAPVPEGAEIYGTNTTRFLIYQIIKLV
jgi:hypothetical protein